MNIQKVFILFLLILYTGSSQAMFPYKNRIAKESVTHITGLEYLIRKNRQQKREMNFWAVFGPAAEIVNPIVVSAAKAVGFGGFTGLTIMGANNRKEAIQKKIEYEAKQREEQEARGIPIQPSEACQRIMNDPRSIEWDYQQRFVTQYSQNNPHLDRGHIKTVDENGRVELRNPFSLYSMEEWRSEQVQKDVFEGRIRTVNWWGGIERPAPRVEKPVNRDITPPTPPNTGCGDINPIKVSPHTGHTTPLIPQIPTHTGHVNNPPLSDLDKKPGCGSDTSIQQPTHTGHTTPVQVIDTNILNMARDPNSPLYAPGPPKADEIRDKNGGPPKHDWKPAKDYTGDIGTHIVPGRKDEVKGHKHEDKCVFVPTGEGTKLAHGGAHYDVQVSKNCPQVASNYVNVYPGKPTKDANGKPVSNEKEKGTTTKFDKLGAIKTAIDASQASASTTTSASISTTSPTPAPTSGSSSILGRLFWRAKQPAPVSPIVSEPTKQSDAPIKQASDIPSKKVDAPVKQASNIPEKKVESAPQQPQGQPAGQPRDVKIAETMSLVMGKDGNMVVINSKDCGNPEAIAKGIPVQASKPDQFAIATAKIHQEKRDRVSKNVAPWWMMSSTPAEESDYDRQQRQMREDYNKWRRGGY